jgi:hypothetical protein
MPRPTHQEIKAMSANRLLYLLLVDTAYSAIYRQALLFRMAQPDREPVLVAIDAEKNQHPQPSPHPSQPAPLPPQPTPPPPAPQPSQYQDSFPLGKHWETDKDLELESDFQKALQTLCNTVYYYWEKGPKTKKEAVDVLSFFQSIIKEKKTFAQLSESQQMLVGMARRFHSIWTRRNNEEMKYYIETMRFPVVRQLEERP